MHVKQRNVPVEVNEPSNAKRIERFDVFTKLPTEYKEKSMSGAAVSIVTFLFIGVLLIMEIHEYIYAPVHFSYDIDKDHDSKLRINVDITVAMPCKLIGADVVDHTGSSMSSESELIEEDVAFEFTPSGGVLFNSLKSMNTHLRTNYASLQLFLWNRRASSSIWRSNKDQMHLPADTTGVTLACRIHGSVFVRKMPGNFHITAGKHVDFGFGGAHAHLTGFLNPSDYNFSHRVHHFSFGDANSNIVNPLDAEEVISTANYQMFQYFVQVVATRVRTMSMSVDTYQYSVNDHNRTINHNTGSHGMPGIYLRYDIFPLLVNVVSVRIGLAEFFVRLSAIVGGVFATAGFLHLVVTGVWDCVTRRFNMGKYRMLPLDVVSK